MKYITGHTYTDEEGDTLEFRVFVDENGMIGGVLHICGPEDLTGGVFIALPAREMYELAEKINSIEIPTPLTDEDIDLAHIELAREADEWLARLT